MHLSLPDIRFPSVIILNLNNLEILEEEYKFNAPQNSVLLSVCYFIHINISFQIGSFVPSGSYTLGNENGFPGMRQSDQESDCLPLSSA
jgi:hypothetical protein